jgi:hypothetical protein
MEFKTCDEEGNAVKKTAENIVHALDSKFEQLTLGPNLHRKISFTTDQGSNIKKALQHHSRINCIAHVLNIILTHTFKKSVLEECAPHVLTLLTSCKSLVEYLKRSGVTQMLATTVKQECSSRWNTKFDMLWSVHQNFEALEAILETSSESHRLYGIDKHLLARVLLLLKPFKTATLVFECEQKPTIHLVLPHMRILKEKLMTLRDERGTGTVTDEVQSIAAYCLHTVFDAKFVPHNVHKIAAFLWPEYKQLRYLMEDERQEVYDLVKHTLHDMIVTSDIDLSTNSSNDSPDEIMPESENGVDQEVGTFLAKYKDIHTDTMSDHMTQINVEMELYRGNAHCSNNIVQWWRAHENDFPRLTKLARHILCIPTSSAASERCFSTANRILEERRSNLRGENLDAILFLHSLQQE